MNLQHEEEKKRPDERKGPHLNEAFRGHGRSLSCGRNPNPQGDLQTGSHFYPELVLQYGAHERVYRSKQPVLVEAPETNCEIF